MTDPDQRDLFHIEAAALYLQEVLLNAHSGLGLSVEEISFQELLFTFLSLVFPRELLLLIQDAKLYTTTSPT